MFSGASCGAVDEAGRASHSRVPIGPPQGMPERPRGSEPPWPGSALAARKVANVIAWTIDRETDGSKSPSRIWCNCYRYSVFVNTSNSA